MLKKKRKEIVYDQLSQISENYFSVLRITTDKSMIYRVIAFNFLQSKVRANKNSPSSFTENTEKPDTQARKTSYSFSDFDPVRTLLIFRLKKKKKKKKKVKGE